MCNHNLHTLAIIPQEPAGESVINNNTKRIYGNGPLYPKEVFLTFDDGPSETTTLKILKILKDNNVKGTFFVIGKKCEKNPEILKELKANGMAIASHTYTHEYKVIYKNVENYFNDLDKCNNTIKNITGSLPLNYTRLPGGSDNLMTSKRNMEDIRKHLKERGICYVDWNVSSADAASDNVPASKIYNNVMKQCKNKNLAVVLMHDAYYKRTTVEALPSIIKNLKEQGFYFRTFEDLSEEEEKIMIRCGIINR